MKMIILDIILIALASSWQCEADRSDKSETHGSFLTDRSVNNETDENTLTDGSINNEVGSNFMTDRSVKDAKGLPVGASAPMFSAIDAENNIFVLNEALKSGPVVLIFYRGHWCPVCNKHLGQIQDSLQLIEEMGAKVIAVSPEKPEYLGVMEEKTGAQFTLLYDEGYKIADAYDVTFKPSASTLFTYNTFLGANLKETHSDDSQRLPIPATYIIGQDGKMAWRQFDPDYKNRSSVKEIIENLP